MIKKTIKYMTLDGVEVEEDFYFHYSKAEIAAMELSVEGGLSAMLQSVVAQQNPKIVLDTFKKILIEAVGKRSDDGRRFIKSEEISKDFEESMAYAELFMELVTNAGAAAEFINGIVPQDLAEQVAVLNAKGELDAMTREILAPGGKVIDVPMPEEPEDKRPAWIRENREPTRRELAGMSKAQVVELMQRKMRQRAGIDGVDDLKPDPVEDTRPAWLREGREPTAKEILGMGPEEFALARTVIIG